jgi:tellurite methyltransferase
MAEKSEARFETWSEFGTGRRETVRYHEELYSSTPLGTSGTWLARPHSLVLAAIDLARGVGPAIAYDLGAGVGRHTIPMAEGLPAGSRLVAVDLLPAAIALLEANCAAAGIADLVTTVVQDLETYEFEDAAAGLIVGFSALEHLSSPSAMSALLSRCAAATTGGGVVAIGVVADRTELLSDGSTRRAEVEFELSAEQALEILDEVFAGWAVERRNVRRGSVTERRGSMEYVLQSTLVQFIGRRPL